MISPQPSFARSGSTNFYYSFVFLPAEKRRAIEAVYDFARRGDDLVDGGLPVAEAQRGLERYRADLAACYEDHSAQSASAASPPAGLARAIRRFNIPRQPFEDLICGLEMDLRISRYPTFADLEIYCYRVASTIGLIAIEIFGYRNPATRDYAVNLGKALQLVNILRDIGSDARRGRIYLPLEDLSRFEVTPESVLRGRPAGRFRDLIEFEGARAEAYFSRARSALPREDRASMRSAEIMAAIYWRLLGRVRRSGASFPLERIRLSRAAKLWTALSVFLGADWWPGATQ